MTFLNAEMIMLENINTAVVESPIPAPLIADVVTANVGHIPNIKTKVGFSFTIPLINRSISLVSCLITSFRLFEYATQLLTALVTARLVIVAPLMASTLESSFLPDPSFTTSNLSAFVFKVTLEFWFFGFHT